MQNSNIGDFIVLIIQTVVFVTPVLVLFYKQGRKDQVIDELKKDVDGIGKKLAEVRGDHEGAIAELKSKVDKMNDVLIELNVTLKFIKNTVEEIKGKNNSKKGRC